MGGTTHSAGSVPASDEIWQPDFDWITDQLAVGGSFPMERTAELARDHRIKAVIDLRQEDCDDVELLASSGITFLHLPTPDMHPARVDALERGVTFAREHLERGERVLIHCQHGIGRSALLALCVMVDSGMEPLAAIAQAKDRRERVSPSPRQFDGWCAWLRQQGHAAPDKHDFGCIAYRHLAGR